MVPLQTSVLPAFLALLLAFSLSGPSPALGLTEEEQNHINVYKMASQGVANITSTVVTYDFFLRPLPKEGAGSGMVLDKKGHILTNNHVIKNAQSIEVTLADQSRYKGRLVGVYAPYDLAVIRIKAPPNRLFPLPLGRSHDLQVGQEVMAIGNPFGLGSTLTTGIISSLDRSVQSNRTRTMDGLIQTDASINPGNSGGPLLDSGGRVIGINTAILSPSGGSIGIGFAVPADVITRVVPELIEKGYVALPWLGVTVLPMLPGLAEFLDIRADGGVLVIEVAPNSPARAGGIRGPDRRVRLGNALLPIGGDVILAINGKEINQDNSFTSVINQFQAGDRVRVLALRDGRKITLTVTLGEMPAR